MYARQWRCKCPAKHKDGFLSYLKETGIKESSQISGYRGHQVLVRESGNLVEVTLNTYWESIAAIRAFAGDDIESARLYPEDKKYEIQAERHVTHYEVLEYSFLQKAYRPEQSK